MSDNVVSAADRMLRDIQRELADMRDDRTVIVAILNRLDAAVSGHTVAFSSHSAEMRALRSQFDRFRTETRETLGRIEQLLTKEG